MLRVAALAGIAVIAFSTGWQVQGWRRDSVDAELARLAKQQEDQQRVMVRQISADTQAAISRIRIEHQTIHAATRREVIREPIYLDADCAVPAAGSRLLNSARVNASSD